MIRRAQFCVALLAVALCHAEEPVAGIGVAVEMRGDKLTILNVLPKTPAAEAGLQQGWVIVMVDGMLTAGKSAEDCIAKIRGPAGTKVRLELVEPIKGDGKAVVLTRRVIQLSP